MIVIYCCVLRSFSRSLLRFLQLTGVTFWMYLSLIAVILRMVSILESDSESDDGESGHFSYLRNREWKSKAPRKDAPSKFCVSLKIGKGFATLFCLLKVPSKQPKKYWLISFDQFRLNLSKIDFEFDWRRIAYLIYRLGCFRTLLAWLAKATTGKLSFLLRMEHCLASRPSKAILRQATSVSKLLEPLFPTMVTKSFELKQKKSLFDH